MIDELKNKINNKIPLTDEDLLYILDMLSEANYIEEKCYCFNKLFEEVKNCISINEITSDLRKVMEVLIEKYGSNGNNRRTI